MEQMQRLGIFLYFCNPTAARAFTIAGRIKSYTQYYPNE